MYLTCNCLNVSIKTKGNQLCKINIDDKDLNINEQDNAFFTTPIATTKELENIMKEQPGLVEVQNVGSWVIHRCYNCLMYTHAVHRELGASMVLINCNLINSEEEILRLKASPNYSPVFRIVIDRRKMDVFDPSDYPSKFSGRNNVSQLSSNVRLALGGLEQQLEESIHKQAKLIDERIKAYTKEQYAILEEFRERVHNEHNYLTRLILSEKQTANISNSLETPPATPETIQPINHIQNDVVDDATIRLNKKNAVSNHNSVPLKIQKDANKENVKIESNYLDPEFISYDGEGLFFFEGMDDTPMILKNPQISDYESDAEDSGNESNQVIRNHEGGNAPLARSLPVDVPVFHQFSRRTIQDENDEQISENPIDPHNIQASIKALAKSVHGDAVFGDLPRPRFSTQI